MWVNVVYCALIDMASSGSVRCCKTVSPSRCRLRTCRSSWRIRRSRWPAWRSASNPCRPTLQTRTRPSPRWRRPWLRRWTPTNMNTHTHSFTATDIHQCPVVPMLSSLVVCFRVVLSSNIFIGMTLTHGVFKAAVCQLYTSKLNWHCADIIAVVIHTFFINPYF